MAEVIGKSAVFCHYNNNKGQIFPMRCSLPATNSRSVRFSSLKSDFGGLKVALVQKNDTFCRGSSQSFGAKMGLCIGKAHKWWEKGLQPNMKEISSAEDLVDSLTKAGDKLVIVDFFSPGCGGCKALHPKICQFAEMNPDVQFLQVNYEEHKSMCYSLNVHVLPFFRFYRGAEGRICSFSCTNATIKKFKDALAKYTPTRCGLGPTKGLEEKELLALAANKDLSFTYTPKPVEPEAVPATVHQEALAEADVKPTDEAFSPSKPNAYSTTIPKSSRGSEEKTLVAAGR